MGQGFDLNCSSSALCSTCRDTYGHTERGSIISLLLVAQNFKGEETRCISYNQCGAFTSGREGSCRNKLMPSNDMILARDSLRDCLALRANSAICAWDALGDTHSTPVKIAARAAAAAASSGLMPWFELSDISDSAKRLALRSRCTASSKLLSCVCISAK